MPRKCLVLILLLFCFAALAQQTFVSLAYAGHDEAKAAYAGDGSVLAEQVLINFWPDFKGTFREYKVLAESGDAKAQWYLGQLYENGEGVQINYSEALKWYRKSADQGNYHGQLKLGLMYHNGRGVPQNYEEAANWFRKVAAQGEFIGQFMLGQIYFFGRGVPQDYSEAFRWYRKSAGQGFADAQCALGAMYCMGWGVLKNYEEAAIWFRKAADQGLAKAQFRLGDMYANGLGVLKNYTEAINWFRKAADQGDMDAQRALASYTSSRQTSLTREIPLEKRGGVYELPVRINGVLTLNFILDTGASEVSIPADVALTLLRTGTITQSDFLPGKFYELADGSIAKNSRLIIRELDLGVIKINQVPASIGSTNSTLLLGQSFLSRLDSWSLDNKRHVLVVGSDIISPK